MSDRAKAWDRSEAALRSGEPKRFLDVAAAHKGPECLAWPYARSSNGYTGIRLNGKRRSATRIVCEKVNGPPPTLDHHAAHNCGKGHEGCISGSHLEWKTPVENAADQLRHGTAAKGERSGRAKLKNSDVLEIRRMSATGRPQKDIAIIFGVAQNLVNRIVNRRIWRHI